MSQAIHINESLEITRGRPRKYATKKERDRAYYLKHREKRQDYQREYARNKKRMTSNSPTSDTSNSIDISIDTSDDTSDLLEYYESKV
jgi:hypothetical protein